MSIKGKAVFSNGPKILPRIFSDCAILYSLVFDKFLLSAKLVAKALRRFEICVLVKKNYAEN